MIRREAGGGRLPQAGRATAGFHVLLCAWLPGGRPMPTPADLWYDSADPYAVRLALYAGDDRTVDWVFARELLEGGVHRRVGVGDVVAEPVSSGKVNYVRITLRTASNAFYVQLPSSAAMSFIRRTHSIVRPGTEHRYVDLDQVVHRLIADTD